VVQDEDEGCQGMLGGLRVRPVLEMVVSGFSDVGSPTVGRRLVSS
jgi:hypothetical protein